MENGLQIVGLLAVGALLTNAAPASAKVPLWVVVLGLVAVRLWQVWG